MSKLQTVYIKARPIDCYGDTNFDIREVGTDYMVRADLGTYKTAIEIALRIDAQRIVCGNEYMGADQ